jgi:hypothetical protein
MEFIDGKNAAELLAAAQRLHRPPPPVEVAAQIVRDAALGLDHAHHATDAQGRPLRIVHRDVSPQNLMVRFDGVTKVVDFGIARAANRQARTRTGAVKGKLSYMAPEQLLGRELDGAGDQFALGVVLWELLTGARLFTGGDDVELMRKVLGDPIPPPSSRSPAVPAALDALVLRMLERESLRRFPRLADVAAALKPFTSAEHGAVSVWVKELSGMAVKELTPPAAPNFLISLSGDQPAPALPVKTVATPSPTQTSPGRAPPPQPPRRSRRAALALLAVAATALAGVAAFELSQTEKPPRISTPPPPPADAGVAVVQKEPPPIPPLPGRLEVLTIPAGATVLVDDRPMGQSPLTVELSPGISHSVRAQKAGFRPQSLDVSLDAGELASRELRLEPRGPPPRPPPSSPPPPVEPVLFTLDTVPWTNVFEGNQRWGNTPVTNRAVSEGVHKLTFVNEEKGINVTREITVTKANNRISLRLP